ncbi:hypothetical protein SUGI_1044100 [Cryptomeria japonica]|nr:hypothetical protein SUGI_1044060 [Cryptomeria japonica]GLJ49360.1 hypothetical protein SUGI_1044080 [Cryptomeria japonica]GLJ49361.1 hypothetical protein SUGI_1044100 [Cryptomeria japonica]
MAFFSFKAAPLMTIGFSVLIVIFLWWVLKRGKKNAKRLALPPGPFAWPAIGNLHQLGDLPHRSLEKLSKKYGELMFMRLGSVPTLVVSSAQMAKDILTTHDLVFGNRPATAAARYVAYGEIDPGLAPYGPYWRHMRKISVMQLLSVKRVDSFACLREEEAAVGVRSIWDRSLHGKLPVNVTAAISSIISSIMWGTLAGTNTGSYSDLLGSSDELRMMINEVINMVDQHVERNAKVDAGENEHVKDLVDVLLDIEKEEPDGENGIKVTREHIKAIIFDMFLGGTETTIVTLEWAMSEMLRNPRMAKKLQEEIESIVGKHRMNDTGRDFNMLPFGAGRRGCPGAYLATRDVEFVLAQLMHCFDWKLEANKDPSQLDMSEAFTTSIPRKVNLFAIPTFKVDMGF